MCRWDYVTTDALPELPPEAEARMQALLADQRARRATEDSAIRARKQLWLTHHWPNEYERCVTVGGRHVCRRCLVLYPVALAVLFLSASGFHLWPESLDVWVIWLSCLPATADFMAEKLFDTPYNPRRQVLVTAMVALGVGRGLHYEIQDRWSWLFWGPVLVFGGLWFAAAVFRAQRSMFAAALEASRASGDFAEASDHASEETLDKEAGAPG